jgi:tetratricopeptide (TPR) repeat protein
MPPSEKKSASVRKRVFIALLFGIVLSALIINGYVDRPDQIRSLNKQVETQLQAGKHQEAFVLLQDLVELDPNNPSHHFQLARVYQAANNWEEAQKELQLALTLSDTPTIREELSKVQITIAEPAKIAGEIAFWEKEMTTKPDYRDGWLQLAVRYYQLKKTEEARYALSKAYEIDPNFDPTKKLQEIIR